MAATTETPVGRRTFIAGALAAGAAAPLARLARAERPVVVAGSVSRTGRFAEFGEITGRGLTLWQEQVNASGGLSGRLVRLDLADDASDPDVAQRLYQDKAAGADLLIAPYGSWLTRAVLPVVEAAGRPCLAPSAGDADIWAQPRRWLLQLLNPSHTMLHSAVEVAAAKGLASAAFLRREDAFSRLVVGGAAARARRRGLEVRVGATYRDAEGARRALDRLAQAGGVELVVAMGFTPDAEAGAFRADADMLLRVVREAGVPHRLLCLGIGAAERDFPAGKPPGAVEGVLGSTGWRSYLPTPGNAAFLSAFEARWGAAPDAHAAQGYAAGEVFDAAWRRAAPGVGEPAAGSLRTALLNLDTETVFGRFKVDESGLQVGKDNAVVQWQGGQPVVVAPGRYATGPLALGG